MNSMRSRLILSHLFPVLIMTPLIGIVLIYVLETQVLLVNLSNQLARQPSLLADVTSDYPEVSDVMMPVSNPEQQIVGIVSVRYVLASVQERFWRLRYLTLIVLGVGMVLGLSIGLFSAVALERPLAKLTLALTQLAGGQELAPMPEQGPTELCMLARTFNTLVDRLRMFEATRQRLLANLTHELGRPLGAFDSAVYALLHGAGDDPALRTELLAGIQAELDRLRRLLNDLSRLDEQVLGRRELELYPTVVSEWLSTVLTPWREAALHKGLSWQVARLDSDLTLVIDPDRLAQALGNLLSNAVKYTPAGGAICVTTGVGDSSFWIKVSDTGPGIAAQEQGLIFEPFYRIRSLRRFPQGMGLGLTIARDLVAAHGGQLDVESTAGVGSEFIIRLPLREATTSEGVL